MTEKRYKHMCNEFGEFTTHSVFDTETKGTYGDDNYQKIVDLLNEQDQKLKTIEKLLDNELKKSFNNRINHDDYAEDAELAEYFKGYHCGVGDLEKKIKHILFNK